MTEGGAMRDGSWYWDRGGHDSLVVMVAWMFSKRRYIRPYTRLFHELGAECLVCQPKPLNLWFPKRAAALAVKLLDEITEELKKRLRPVYFASFSGGMKACTYIIIQILQGASDVSLTCDKARYDLVRKCTAGFIFDSTPVNFSSDTGVLFLKRMLGNAVGGNVLVKFGLQATAKVLDAMFSSEWATQRRQLRNAFFYAVAMAPVLLLCSKNDKLAPFDEIQKFCSEAEGMGKILLFCWEESDHVAHLRFHPEEYRNAVPMLLCNNVEQPQAEPTFVDDGYDLVDKSKFLLPAIRSKL